MIRYLIEPRDRIFLTGYGFLSFAKDIGKNICKKITKNLNTKYNKRLFDHAKQSTASGATKGAMKLLDKKYYKNS